MIDFRLKVFHTVAKRLNFTKASAELFISQPAVTRHIKELELRFKISLFERSGNKKISLTPAGETLLQYTEQISCIYRELEYDMGLLVEQQNGILRIGASSTAAQYIIPKILARFRQKFKDIKLQFLSGNTTEIEQALLEQRIDLGITEGYSRNPQIRYEAFIKDEIVLICANTNLSFKKTSLRLEELKAIPLLMREPGSGTLEVISLALKQHQLTMADLQIEMQLNNTESIKSYLPESKSLAFLSIHAIMKELNNNEYRIIDIQDLTIERPFYLIQRHGQPTALAELFTRFAQKQK